jgi:uncharacterized protein
LVFFEGIDPEPAVAETMKIQVGGLAEGLHTYHFEIQPSDLELAENFGAMIRVDIRLDRRGHRYLVEGAVGTELSLECDRCVTRFTRPVSGTYRMLYVQDAAETGGLDPSEFQIVPEGLTVIDVGEDVRQTAMLAIPLKILCKDECRGLCPSCGTNLNEQQCECKDTVADPRWDKLRSLPRN